MDAGIRNHTNPPKQGVIMKNSIENSPVISFIIPFYNRYDLVNRAIENILTADCEDIEIIVVDDASKEDGCINIVDALKRCCKMIRYFKQDKNTGPGPARNRGLTEAIGEWVFFMDSDDIIYPNVLPKLINYLKSKNETDMIVFNHFDTIGKNSEVEHKHFNIVSVKYGFPSGFWTGRGASIWNFVFKRNFLEKNAIKFLDLPYHEDNCFTMTAYFYSQKINVFNSPFYVYSDNNYSNQLTTIRTIKNSMRSQLTSHEEIRKFLNVPVNSIMGGGGDKMQSIREYLSFFILRLFFDDSYLQSSDKLFKFERNILINFYNTIVKYSMNFEKKIYIMPCFQLAIPAAKFIIQIGGLLGGFLDNNPDSFNAIDTKKMASILLPLKDRTVALDVFRPIDLIKFDDKLILLFGEHADEIAAQLSTIKLINEKDFIKIDFIKLGETTNVF
jgi:glycosyltransferase involved in cell wall biosynthesis